MARIRRGGAINIFVDDTGKAAAGREDEPRRIAFAIAMAPLCIGRIETAGKLCSPCAR